MYSNRPWKYPVQKTKRNLQAKRIIEWHNETAGIPKSW